MVLEFGAHSSLKGVTKRTTTMFIVCVFLLEAVQVPELEHRMKYCIVPERATRQILEISFA